MIHRPSLLALAALSLSAAGALAAEPYATYDNFNTSTLSSNRWNQIELDRTIRNGQLVLRQRSIGNQVSNVGTLDTNHSMSLDEPWRISQIKADITVSAWDATACASNTTPSEARARLIGSYFNTGAVTPGSQVNDVLAQVRIYRRTNSALPAGTLNVDALVIACTSADCASSTVIGSVQDLGTTTVGTAVKAQIDWDQANKKFIFTRDAATVVEVPYTLSDTTGPSSPFKSLQTRTSLAHCFSGERTTADIEAKFDNVAVNSSGAN